MRKRESEKERIEREEMFKRASHFFDFDAISQNQNLSQPSKANRIKRKRDFEKEQRERDEMLRRASQFFDFDAVDWKKQGTGDKQPVASTKPKTNGGEHEDKIQSK